MDLQTLEMGNILLAKYRLCENMLEYMSDPDVVTGQKYKEQCGEFFKVFHDEMLVFTHELMTKCGEQFAELHCCEHSEQPDTPTPPTEDKEPKFPIGTKVEIVEGIGKGDIGVVKDYNPTGDRYYVVSDNFYMWFPESDLKVYVEESDVEEDNPSFVVGDRVKVLVEPYIGKIGTIVGFDESDNTIAVILDDDDEETYSFAFDELEKIDPENPEENGGTDTPDEGE